MSRDELLMLVPQRMYDLLGLMFSAWRRWRPKIDYPSSSVGFRSGGAVSIDSYEDFEDEGDRYGVKVVESAYSGLTKAEQTAIGIVMGFKPRRSDDGVYDPNDLTLAEKTAIEVIMGLQPPCWTFRDGVVEAAVAKVESAIDKIDARMRRAGM